MEISIKRVSLMSMFGFTLVMLVACVSAGCVGAPDETADDDCVEPVEPDLPVVDPVDPEPMPEPKVRLTFGGPPAGWEIGAGSVNAEVLCFSIESTHDVEIRALRLEFSTLSADEPVQGGLVNGIDGTPNYWDVKAVDVAAGDLVVAGPVDLSGTCSDAVQTVHFHDLVILNAGSPRTLCLETDMRNSEDMDGDEVRVALLPFAAGDIRFADGSDFPSGNVEPAGGLSTSFRVRYAHRPFVQPLSLPTTTLSTGTQVLARFEIGAPATNEVYVQKLTFRVSGSMALPVLHDFAIREVGAASDEATTAGLIGGENCGGEVGDGTLCLIMSLDPPGLHLGPTTSKFLEVRAIVEGPLVAGQDVTSCVAAEPLGTPGSLTGSAPYYGIDGSPRHFIWSSDLMTYRSGAWLVPVAEALCWTLTRS